MGEVVRLRRRRNETIRGAARQCLSEALNSAKDAQAVVVVVLGVDGTYSLRTANYDGVTAFDMYSRAGALCDRERFALINSD